MSRWYSKQRKQRMTGDFRKQGFIPNRGWLAISQRPRYFAHHLSLCDFTGDCDVCRHPKKADPVYASISHYGEGGSEADFYICRGCLRSTHHGRAIGEAGYYREYSKFNQWKRRSRMKAGQRECGYCGEIVTGECGCPGDEYWRKHDANGLGGGEAVR